MTLLIAMVWRAGEIWLWLYYILNLLLPPLLALRSMRAETDDFKINSL